MIRSRSNSRLCFASPSNRIASASALADLASSRLRAFCRCLLVIVSGAAGACDVVVVVDPKSIYLFNFFWVCQGVRNERITDTMSTLDDAPFAFVFLIGIVNEHALFDDVSIVIP